jgi:signal transduction histidine kinase
VLSRVHEEAEAGRGNDDRNSRTAGPPGEIQLNRPLPRNAENLEDNTRTQNHMVQTIKFQQDMFNTSRQRNVKFVQTINLAEMIENVMEDFQPTLAKHKISVHLELDRGISVKSQKNPLVHGFTNIIKNAIEAIDAGAGEKREIRVDLFGKPGNRERAVIRVVDSGVGIRPEDMPFMFHSGFTTKSDGHGLGLHSLLNFLNENNGSIKIASPGPNSGAELLLEIGNE